MPIKRAKDNYIHKRMNCAESVVEAVSNKFGLPQASVTAHRGHGGGNAPGGVCGAIHGAASVLEKIGKGDKICELEKDFFMKVGSIKCNEIRQNKKLSCIKCIENATDFLIRQK